VKVRELIEVELAKQGVSGYKLEWYCDPDWGYVYIVEVGLNARRALEPTRFKIVLSSVAKQVKHTIIVDNNSANKNLIKGLCAKLDNCELIELKFNSEIAYALKIGIRYAYTKRIPDWFFIS
jgi:hypothetical protein